MYNVTQTRNYLKLFCVLSAWDVEVGVENLEKIGFFGSCKTVLSSCCQLKHHKTDRQSEELFFCETKIISCQNKEIIKNANKNSFSPKTTNT